MCLITKWKKPKTAKRDIPVFKIVRPDSDLPVTLPLQFGIPSDGWLIAKGEHVLHENPDHSCFLHRRYEVGEGFIHSYTKYEYALHNPWIVFRVGRIVKGVIPKGTEYFLSDDGMEICSKQLHVHYPDCTSVY